MLRKQYLPNDLELKGGTLLELLEINETTYYSKKNQILLGSSWGIAINPKP